MGNRGYSRAPARKTTMKMILITATATVLALAGCAGYQSYDQSSPRYKQCAYQAELATSPNMSPLAGAMRRVDLIQMCMQQG